MPFPYFIGAMRAQHPNTVIIDPIEAVERVMSRASTCEILARLCTEKTLGGMRCPFRSPKWFVALTHSEALASMRIADFSFPVICKPVAACGTS
jgi:hypothetical protein